jgi:hypothetical protein
MVAMYVILSAAAQTSLLVVLSQLAFLGVVFVVGKSVTAAKGREKVWPQLVLPTIGGGMRKLLLKGKTKVLALRGSSPAPAGTRALPPAGGSAKKEVPPRGEGAKQRRGSR